MHSMTFHFGLSETILFDGWQTSDWTGMGCSMLGLVLLATIYEGLKSYREHMYNQTAYLKKHHTENRSRKKYLFSELHLLQTVLHMIQFVLAYFLMLIFMTYNVWLCLALVLGTGIGYWLFSWEKSNNDNNECCM